MFYSTMLKPNECYNSFMRRIRRMFHKFPSPLPLIFIVVVTIVVIFYGRGYRPDGNSLKSTGLLSITSDPKGAQVLVDGVLKTATDNTINIDPGWYSVTINKEGYIPWQKRLRVQGEVVTRADPFLFPTSPSLSPLTVTGIEHPVLSPNGTKIAYTIPLSPSTLDPKRAGLWIYELIDRPLGLSRDQLQLDTSTTSTNFSGAKITWSPDSEELLVATGSSTKLYKTNRTADFQDVTASVNRILDDWETEKRLIERQKLASFKQPIVNMATSSARIIAFSPDETKFLYEATQSATLEPIIIPPLIGTNSTEEIRTLESGKIYVYDSREDKNYFILDTFELPKSSPSLSAIRQNPKVSPKPEETLQTLIHWFPTSRHLALTFGGKIDIMEYDRTNWATVYSGPFQSDFMAPYPNGSRIIIVTNLNPGVSTLPNLYTVNLR